MKKLICILSCLLLIASTVIVSSAASDSAVNVLKATDYFVDKLYEGDNVTVEYDFPLKPEADVFGWNSVTNSKIYLGGASGNPLKYNQGASFNSVFNSIQYYISPLGFINSNGSSLANVIDLTGVKSGSDFLVHFSFDIYITEISLFNYDNLAYYFNIVDSDLNIVQKYKIPMSIHDFTQIGDFSYDGNRYRYDGQLRFNVPESGLYVYPQFDTDFLDFTLNDSAAQISFEFNYFKLFIDKSAFEENSVAMQQIQNSIDSGFSDVNNNLNDIENVLKDDPDYTPETSPLNDDVGELEDLEGDINDQIHEPIVMPDGSAVDVNENTITNFNSWWKEFFNAPEYEATAGRLYARVFEAFMPYLGTPVLFSLLFGLILAFLTGRRSI